MDRIKDLTQIIVPETYILVKVVEPKRNIILTDGSDAKDVYGLIIMVHKSVTDLTPGDIVVSMPNNNYSGFELKEGDRIVKYILIPRGVISLAVHPDNFIDPTKLVDKVRI